MDDPEERDGTVAYERSTRLGGACFRVTISNKRGAEELRINILDRHGKHVTGVRLEIALFHYTRVAEQQKVICTEKDGFYLADAKLHKPGLWNMDIEGETSDGRKIWSQQTIRWEMTP